MCLQEYPSPSCQRRADGASCSTGMHSVDCSLYCVGLFKGMAAALDYFAFTCLD